MERKMRKKAQGLSLNVIIIAILALVVLVILIFVFSGQFGKFTGRAESCAALGGKCISASDTCQGPIVKGDFKDETNCKRCCIEVLPKA